MNKQANLSVEEGSLQKQSFQSVEFVSPSSLDPKPANENQPPGGNSSTKAFDLIHSVSVQTTKVADLFTQLQNYLDNLGSKFNEVQEKHQADFLIAYKNHMGKVRRELQELKQKSEEQEKQMKQNDRLNNMDKQLNWFREESIKLYQKVEMKGKENYELKFRMDEMEKDKNFLENQVKALLKKNRHLEVYLHNTQEEANLKRISSADQNQKSPNQNPEIDNTFYTNVNQVNYGVDRIKSKVNSRIEEEGEGLYSSQHFQKMQLIITKYLPAGQDPTGVTLELTGYVRIIETQRDKVIKQLQNKLQQVVRQSTRTNIVRSDMENFFLDCVETVRRQIIKRLPRQPYSTQKFVKEIKDYAQFRTEDKMKVLELLLTHEKLLVYLYQKIFPSNFNTYVQSFSNGLAGATNNMDQAVNMVAQKFQDRSLQLVKDGMTDFQQDDLQHEKIASESFSIARKEMPLRAVRSISLKTSEKVMVKKGKLIFKPL